MKILHIPRPFLLFIQLVFQFVANAQFVHLDSLYVSKPTDSERDSIIRNFRITLKDGDESYAKWNLYDPFFFDPTSTKPSVYSLVNTLRSFREHKFSKPFPIGYISLYDYFLSHFGNGGIELSLRAGYNYGGGNWIYLSANAAFWDGRTSDHPFSPFQQFSLYPFTDRIQLLVPFQKSNLVL
jgi:hypothetical protein